MENLYWDHSKGYLHVLEFHLVEVFVEHQLPNKKQLLSQMYTLIQAILHVMQHHNLKL